METPNIRKGYLYPSSRVSRCPHFHPCVGTHKCQNYDKHNLQCAVCETRSSYKQDLGGYTAEGTWHPDLQDSIMTLQKIRHAAMADPDRDPTIINGQSIINKYQKMRKASEQLAHFTQMGGMTMEEKIVTTMADPETAKLLGQLD